MGYLIRFVLFAGAPFGAVMWLFADFLFSRVTHLSLSPWLWIGGGLFCGVAMAATVGLFHVSQVRSRGPGGLSVRQRRVIVLRGSRDDLRRQVVAAVAAHPRAAKPTETDSKVTATTRMSWKSWSEQISVAMSEIEPGQWRLTVESRPRLVTTLADYGRAHENVDAVVASLRAQDRTGPRHALP